MTFQVGIVGTDGVLLASDQLQTVLGEGVRLSGSVSKFVLDADKRVAYCASGGKLSLAVASHYAKTFHEGNTEHCLIESRESVLQEHPDFCAFPEYSEGDFLLAQTIGRQVELWHMHVKPGSYDAPQRVSDRLYIGDTRNPATFFVERYVPLVSGGEELQPLERLKLLAAHTIRTAARLNPTGIRGLEMLICKPDGFNFVSEQEIADLKSRSDILDREIEQWLFPRRI